MSRNYVINGAFDIFTARSGVTTTTAQWIAARWLLGPGVGATVSWAIHDFDGLTMIPGQPRHYVRLTWANVPTQGENPPDPRFTFIENHGLRDARQLQGCYVDVTWWLKVASGTVPVLPIIWHNYVDGDYQVFSGEAFPIREQKGWQPLTQTIYVPSVPVGKSVDNTSYVGFGLDFILPTAPTLDVACVSAVRKEHELTDPQVERVKATGQFWN